MTKAETEARQLRRDVERSESAWTSLVGLAETYREATPEERRVVLEEVVRRIVLAPNAGRAGGKIDLGRLRVE